VGIEKPGNLGAMARTADAAGCAALLLGDSVVDPFNPHAIRNSTGAVFALPTIPLGRAELVDFAQASGLKLAVSTLEQARPHAEADLTGPTGIVVGPEATGLDPDWHAVAEATGGPRVRIPMRGRVADSLNAANAAAVLLFESVRQRAGY
jgi:TrmH family RNA methyltransferase